MVRCGLLEEVHFVALSAWEHLHDDADRGFKGDHLQTCCIGRDVKTVISYQSPSEEFHRGNGTLLNILQWTRAFVPTDPTYPDTREIPQG